RQGRGKAALVGSPGATTADLYLEPSRVESGRPFSITLRFDDGQTVEFSVSGGKADPNLRMPRAAVKARWVGQDRQDRVGTGPSVGPDGLADALIPPANRSPKIGIRSVARDGPNGASWRLG